MLKEKDVKTLERKYFMTDKIKYFAVCHLTAYRINFKQSVQLSVFKGGCTGTL